MKHKPRFVPHRVLGAKFKDVDPELVMTQFESEENHSFDDSLVRGISITHVLRSGGSMLSSSHGSLSDFNLSKQMKVIDKFISHNWDTHRISKFLALSIETNFRPAFLTAVAVAILLGTLDIFGQLPVTTRKRGDEVIETGSWCAFLVYPFCLLVMLTLHEVSGKMGFAGQSVFLDKACIDQEDPKQRQRGIDAIPFLIASSKKMVVVLTPLCLQKVWTTFELCLFLLLHGGNNLHVQPALLVKISLSGSLLVYLGSTAVTLIYYFVSESLQQVFLLILLCSLLPFSFAGIVGLRSWGSELHELHQQAETFDFETAMCAVDSDRQHVKIMLMSMFKENGAVATWALNMVDDDDAKLDAERTKSHADLRCLVARTIRQAVGTSGVPLRFLIVAALPNWSREVDSVSADLRTVILNSAPGFIALQTLLKSLLNATFTLACLSLVCYLATNFCQQSDSHWRRFKSFVVQVICVLLLPQIAIFSLILDTVFPSKTRAPDQILAAATVSLIFNCCLVWMLHRSTSADKAAGREAEALSPSSEMMPQILEGPESSHAC